ncbi:hypothetical protein SAMN05444008_104145 [Cnuella takakiae]|uniref:Uncharacterized protein n=1 Tax=Cnuella takakiae TaxID=1302690 RepID=A0A1M4Y429_9BACT|nr:hypothetical protein [Cnuella takakiae]OLY93042.1 hypothetical protein BUE76_14905 [Cnuella takakiae]SHF00458.1 hypothetical protein SAMN05444008_104145 [Cnuella takakiae]
MRMNTFGVLFLVLFLTTGLKSLAKERRQVPALTSRAIFSPIDFVLTEADAIISVNDALPGGSIPGKLQVFLVTLFKQDELAFERDYTRVQLAIGAAASQLTNKPKGKKGDQQQKELLSFATKGKWS